MPIAKIHTPYASIGHAIRTYREAKKLTQVQLAKRIGICQGSISHYEQDKVTPPVRVIQKLAFELGCPINLLVGQRPNFLS